MQKLDLRIFDKYLFAFRWGLGEDINDNTTMFFIFEEAKKKISDFSHGTVKVL